jgi:molybdopterin molybdotransferase
MRSFEQALAETLARAKQWPAAVSAELVPTMLAAGRITASPIVSGMDVPPHDNTQMDGYALRSAEVNTSPSNGWPVSQRVPAGAVPTALVAGSLARVFTGAPIPPGADAVVAQEATKTLDNGLVQVLEPVVREGQWIRRRGEDIQQGAVLIDAGHVLSAQALGLVASVGLAQVSVQSRLRVACFFTGNELVMPGEPLPPGAIYNSNRFVITNALEQWGCKVTDLGIVRDDLQATREMLRQAAASHDVIITCGGVSVGEEDHVKPAVMAEGSLDVWQVAIKPGKPIALGRVGQAHFVGLPGNPVSAWVTLLMLVRPFVLALQGVQQQRLLAPPRLPMVAGFDWPKPDKRREFLRAKVGEHGRLALFTHQGSGVLTSTVWADGLVDTPPATAIKAGDTVAYIPLLSLVNL